MRGMIRMVALGAVLATGAATGAMAQGVNNTGYSRQYYGASPNYYYGNGGYYGGSNWYDRQGYGRYGYAPAPNYGPPGDSYGSSSPYAPGWWGTTYGPAQQAPWGYGGEYGYNAGFRSPTGH